MFFARYMRGAKVGRFTEGKVYFASDPLEGRSATGDSFNVEDDCGGKFLFRRDDGHFEFPSEVYVCCIKAVVDFSPGDVLSIRGADNGSLEVTGYGWMQTDHFEVVDASNFQVGSYVQDDDGRWLPVKDVRPDMSVLVGNHWQSLDSFKLPISGGSVATVPLAKCVDAVAEPRLIAGREYLILREWTGGIEIDLDGKPEGFDTERFTKS
jgi:hypothetical protein